MKMGKGLVILIGVALCGSAMAANWDWDGDGGADTSWANPANWRNDAMYGPDDIPLFRPGDFATVGVGVSEDRASNVFRLGQDGTGTSTVHIVGGDLTIYNNVFLGYRAANPGESVGHMVVSNGSFTAGGSRDFSVAKDKSNGILDMYGGTVTVTRNLIFNDGGGTSTINLYDGFLDCAGLNLEAGALVDITIESGLWEIDGDSLADISTLVTAGDLTGSGANGGADVSAYTIVTHDTSGDLNWGLFVAGGITNTVVYTVGVASDASLSLDPAALLSMDLVAPETVSTGTVDVSFTYGTGSNNVFITDVFVDNAAFTSLGSFPLELTDPTPSNETLSIQFDNSVAGLTDHLQTAGGTISVVWNEDGGSSQTNTLPVELTYQNQPATLVLDPSDILQFIAMSPDTVVTNPLDVSYLEATVDPTNVVIAAVSYTNVIKGGSFTLLTALPVTNAAPAPAVETLDIEFDAVAGGMALNEQAKANMIIKWFELGDTTTNETVYPLVGSYLAPATGIIEDYGLAMPSNNIVFESGANNGATMDAERMHLATDGSYKKVYQSISAGEPELASVTTFDGLVLKMRYAADFTGATSGANQLQIWFGKINEADGSVASTLALETFDCSDQVFTQHGFYQFKLSAPVNFDPANLNAGEAYGYEIWWMAEDAANSIDFWRGNIDSILGGANNTTGNVAVNPGFPIAMDNLVADKDMVFALASGLTLVPPVDSVNDVFIGLDGTSVITSFDGEDGGTYALQRSLDLTDVDGGWVTIVPDITGIGTINITNDVTEAKAFYRMILQ